MPAGTLTRNLNLCFTKIKWPSTPQIAKSVDDENHQFPTSTTSSTFIKNFNTLYDNNSNFIDSPTSVRSLSRSSSFDDPENDITTPPADFAAVCASQRFFFSSPGRSNSIIESTSSSARTANSDYSLVRDSLVVPTYSPDPFSDFRRSMQEMVEARELNDVQSNWENLHELLLCYLALNPKSTHKFIVSAFADLLVSMTAEDGGGRKAAECKCEVSGQCMCNVVVRK